MENNDDNNQNWVREHDMLLPIANVGRIMKQILPPNAKISKESKETMQECVSEFIAFVTGEASDKCRREKRKTVSGEDICWALGNLGFDDYGVFLKRYLQQYRDSEEAHANSSEKGVAFGGGEETAMIHNQSDHDIVASAIPPPPSYGLDHQDFL